MIWPQQNKSSTTMCIFDGIYVLLTWFEGFGALALFVRYTYLYMPTIPASGTKIMIVVQEDLRLLPISFPFLVSLTSNYSI